MKKEGKNLKKYFLVIILLIVMLMIIFFVINNKKIMVFEGNEELFISQIIEEKINIEIKKEFTENNKKESSTQEIITNFEESINKEEIIDSKKENTSQKETIDSEKDNIKQEDITNSEEEDTNQENTMESEKENINKDDVIDSEDKNTNQDEETNNTTGDNDNNIGNDDNNNDDNNNDDNVTNDDNVNKDNNDNNISDDDDNNDNNVNNGNNENTDDENKDDENKDDEQIKIEAPKIEGIEDGEIYNEPIIADIFSVVDTEAVLKDDKGNETEYNSGDVIDEDGKYTLTVTDSEGNVTEIEFTLDQKDPVVTDVPNITNQTVTPSVEDLTKATVTLNGKEYIIGTPITEEGKYTLIVRDEAGNSTTVEFEIDKTNPEALSVTKTPETKTNGDVTVKIEISEAVTTKAAGWIVSDDGKILTKTFTQNTSGSVSFIDLAGNVGSKEYIIENVDTEAPVLSLNGANRIELEYGETYIEQGVEVTDNSFEGTITATDCIIYYEGTKVASVNTTIPGTYEITYFYADEVGNKSSNVYRTVIVKEKIIVSNITINVSTTILNPGDSIKCEAIVIPTDAYNKDVKWSSSDSSILTVDEAGNVTAIAAGTATITASATDGSGVATSVQITVIVDATGIKLNIESLDLKEGDTSKIEAIIEPENATNKNVTFESSNTSVVTVDENGNVTAIEEGIGEIVVKSGDGKVTKNIPVTVSRILVSKITILSSKDIKLKSGNTMNLNATVLPTNAKIKDIKWLSSDDSIATVNENGTVTAITGGTVTITASATDGSGVTTSVKITVIVDVTGIKLNAESLDLKEGDTSKIEAIIEPENATNKNVTFESSDTSIVTVDENGNVKAIEEGIATITVKSGDGNVTKTIPVTISRILVSSITVNATKTALNQGQTATCSATIQPTNAKYKDVIWSSSDSSIITVDENGNITAVAIGTATITASATDGSGVTGKKELKVVEAPNFEGSVKIDAKINKQSWSNKVLTFIFTLEIPSDIAINASEYLVAIEASKTTTTIDSTEKVVTDGKVEFTIGQYLEDGVTEDCEYTITIIAKNEGNTEDKITAKQAIRITSTGAYGFGIDIVKHSKTITFE